MKGQDSVFQLINNMNKNQVNSLNIVNDLVHKNNYARNQCGVHQQSNQHLEPPTLSFPSTQYIAPPTLSIPSTPLRYCRPCKHHQTGTCLNGDKCRYIPGLWILLSTGIWIVYDAGIYLL